MGSKTTRVRVRACRAGPRARARVSFMPPMQSAGQRHTLATAHSRHPAMALGLTPALCCLVPTRSALAGTAVVTPLIRHHF